EHRSESQLTQAQAEQLEQYLADFELTTEVRQYARGRSTTEEFNDLVAELDPYLVVIGGAKSCGFPRFMMASLADDRLRALAVLIASVKVSQPSTNDRK